MPFPMSLTANSSKWSAPGGAFVRAVTRTVPRSVNLIALSSRLKGFAAVASRSVETRVESLRSTPPRSAVLGLGLGPQRLDHVRDDLRWRAGLALDAELARLDPRDIEQVVDQGQQELTVLADDGEVLGDLGGPSLIVGVFSQQLDEAKDGRSAGFVAHGSRSTRTRSWPGWLVPLPPWPGASSSACSRAFSFRFCSVISRITARTPLGRAPRESW